MDFNSKVSSETLIYL